MRSALTAALAGGGACSVFSKWLYGSGGVFSKWLHDILQTHAQARLLTFFSDTWKDQYIKQLSPEMTWVCREQNKAKVHIMRASDE